MKHESFVSVLRTDLSGLNSAARKRIKNTFYRESYQKLRWIALFVFVCQILFIIRDSLAKFYADHPFNYINLVIEISMSLFSLLFFIYSSYSKGEWSENSCKRVVFVMYLLLIALTFIGYSFTDMFVRHETFGVCICFLFILVLIPFFDITRQTLLFGAITLGNSAIYLISFNGNLLGIIGVILTPLLYYLNSIFLRSYFVRTLVQREKTDFLTNELIYRNKTDYLTDVSNRFCLYDDYKLAKEHSTPLGIVLYDIDNFKMYNDTYSHIEGDRCLKETSLAVKAFATSNGGKVYRFGGEEFVVIFFDATKENFRELAPSINGIVSALRFGEQGAKVTVSIGASYTVDSSENIEALLLKCDNALYRAKSNGKDCCIFD